MELRRKHVAREIKYGMLKETAEGLGIAYQTAQCILSGKLWPNEDCFPEGYKPTYKKKTVEPVKTVVSTKTYKLKETSTNDPYIEPQLHESIP